MTRINRFSLWMTIVLIVASNSDMSAQTDLSAIPAVNIKSEGIEKENDFLDNANQYFFSQSSGTYAPLTGGTVVASSVPGNIESYLDDINFPNQPISFSFVFNGVSYTSYNINTNGYITFGSTIPAPGGSSPISSSVAYNGAVSAFGRDLDGRFAFQATTTAGSNELTSVSHFGGIVIGEEITSTNIPSGSTIVSFDEGAGTATLSSNATASANLQTCIAYSAEIRGQTLGVTPNRIHVIQFKNFKRAGTSAFGELYNFQIRLHETSNQIRIIYGTHVGSAAQTTGQVGLRGATNTDFSNRTTTTNWEATTAGLTNTAACTMSAAVLPPTGLTFTFSPPGPCLTPPFQPTNLMLTPFFSSVSGTFSPDPGADSYFVVRSISPTLSALPVDGINYSPGGIFGNGVVVNTGPNATFNATGLTSSTQHYFFVFSVNTNCTGGPKYLTTDPLTGSATTLPNPPSSFTAIGSSQTEISLTANANAAGNDIMVAWNTNFTFGAPSGNYNTGDPIAGGGTVHYIGPAGLLNPHSGLDPGNVFYYRAWSVVDGPGYSPSSISTSASTFCDTITQFPLEEDFDGIAFPPTACWERYSGVLALSSILSPISFGWMHDDWRNLVTGDKAAKVNIYGDQVNFWIVSPSIDLETGGYQLEFDLCLVKWNLSGPPDLNGFDDKFAVVISTDGGDTWSSVNTLRLWDNAGSAHVYNNINPLGESISIDIGSYTGVVRIGFYGESTVVNADNDLMINNFRVLQSEPILVSLKVYLEGPYNVVDNEMNADILAAGLIPLIQPYNPPLPYFGNNAPWWLYEGSESVTTIPSDVVDWVIVQLRDATTAALASNATIIGTKAAFLLSNGSVVDLDGTSNLSFDVSYNQNLFAVVYHRNHLGVISGVALNQTDGVYTYDFSTGSGQVFGNNAGYKQIDSSPVIWGMVSADGDADGIISTGDKTITWDQFAGAEGYFAPDFNMDTQADNTDKNINWLQNYLDGYTSQIPD